MKKGIYLSKNTDEIRRRLKKAGFYMCDCCRFTNNNYLHYFYRESNDRHEIHGTGCSCENDCKDANPVKCFMCSISSAIKCDKRVYITDDVEDFINAILETYIDNTTE